jgi:hypothetical protein
MKIFPMLLLTLAGAGFLGFGSWLIVDPVAGLAQVGVAATSTAGWIELRALYGGLELGLGLFLLICARRPDWRRPGLWLVLLGNGGIGAVRLAGIVSSGIFSSFLAVALAWELGFALLAAAALQAEAKH